MKIVLGTWGMGGKMTVCPDNDDERDISAIRYAISKGITHVDTATLYANGKSEELVGMAIKDLPRDSVFVATKVYRDNMRYQDVLDSCRGSLQRLGLDYVDLFYVHYPSSEVPVQETARALNELVAMGLVKNVGLCNVGIKTIKEYTRYLDVPIYAVQNQYTLIAREPQRKGIIDYCSRGGIKFFAWRPLAKTIMPNGEEIDIFEYPILDEMAKKYGKTASQIAVRWLSQQEDVSVIVKSSNPDNIDALLDTQNFELSREDWELLNTEFPNQKDRSFTGSRGYFDLI